MGSVVLIGFVSHLGCFGLESYVSEPVQTLSAVVAMVGKGSTSFLACRSAGGDQGSGPYSYAF